MLYRPGGADLVAVASLWRARYTEHGSGTSLLIWADPGPNSAEAPTTAAIWTETHPYEYRTTAAIVPCLDASIIVDGTAAIGEVRPHTDVFASSAVLAFCETWITKP